MPTKAIHFNTYVHGNGKEIRRVYVREESCIGCGFCEKVCPVNGRSAIVVEGIQPQVMVNEIDLTENGLFPVSIEQWKREEKPKIYAGKDKLFEYINGGAEVYLSYSFLQVSTVKYIKKDSGNSVKVDIWEFDNSDDAYGIFVKDSAEQSVNIGHEASLDENYLWVWKGKYFITIEPYRGNISPDDVTFVGTSVVDNIHSGKARLPAILGYLPDNGYVQGSSKYFHEKIILDNVYITNKFIEKNVFNLSEETDAVVADYKLDNGSPFKLLIIEYPDLSVVTESFNNFIALRQLWGEKSVRADTIHTFEDSKGKFSSITSMDGLIIATFFAETKKISESYVNDVFSKVRANQN